MADTNPCDTCGQDSKPTDNKVDNVPITTCDDGHSQAGDLPDDDTSRYPTGN